MIPSPFCLYCEARVDSDEAVLVLVDSTKGDPRLREGSWVCPAPSCLERLVAAAEEEGCALLRPQGIFDHHARRTGLPSWVVWMAREKAAAEAEASELFAAIYRPFNLTAR